MKPKQFIQQTIQELETEIADRVGRAINRYSVRTRKVGLILFGVIIGSFCFMLTIGFVGSEDSQHVVRHNRFSRPKDIYTPAIDSVYKLRHDSTVVYHDSLLNTKD